MIKSGKREDCIRSEREEFESEDSSESAIDICKAIK